LWQEEQLKMPLILSHSLRRRLAGERDHKLLPGRSFRLKTTARY